MRAGESGLADLQKPGPRGALTSVAKLDPAEGIGDADGPKALAWLRFGSSESLECLSAVGRGQTGAPAKRSKVEADKLDLSSERWVCPAPGQSLRIAQGATQSNRVQRQRPVRRWRWGGNGGTTRREEDLERGMIADRRCVAGPRHRGLVGSGRANDHRHVRHFGLARSTRAYRPVNADGRSP